MTEHRSGELPRLLGALEQLRTAVAALRLPLETSQALVARSGRVELLHQLDDYLLPRVRRLDAPVLVVVGGSTGAGKSLLVNSLLGRAVTTPGVLRPTTRSPVLAHHPDDAHWFDGERVLPGLARGVAPSSDPGTVQLVACETVPVGLALLDAPDIDSVVTANRTLAAQLLAAADLWLFVTTAARYADAVPWEFLRTARERGTSVAVVLDRVPETAVDVLRHDLAGMLTAQGLGDAPLLVVPEVVALTESGLLPALAVAPVRDFVVGLAADAQVRADIVRRTLVGALASLDGRSATLMAAVDEQAAAADRLRLAVDDAYATAAREVDAAVTDGSLLRGEVLARWQEFVGTGEFLRALESRLGRLRDRVSATLRGRPAPGANLAGALESGVEALVLARADDAADRVVQSWRQMPAGVALLGAQSAPLATASPQLAERTQRSVRDWQGEVLDLVRTEGASRRSTARFLSYGVNGTGLVVMLAVFAHTGGLTGAEGGIALGTSAVGQKLLEALLGDQAVRTLAARARALLHGRVVDLLENERRRFDELVDAVAPDPATAAALERAAVAVRAAREAV